MVPQISLVLTQNVVVALDTSFSPTILLPMLLTRDVKHPAKLLHRGRLDNSGLFGFRRFCSCKKQLYPNVLAAGLEQVCVFNPRVLKNAGFAQHTYSEELRILLLSFETWLFLPSSMLWSDVCAVLLSQKERSLTVLFLCVMRCLKNCASTKVVTNRQSDAS